MSHDHHIAIPIHIVSEANQRGCWRKHAARKKMQRETARLLTWNVFRGEKPTATINVRLVRIAPGTLDDDNLAGAFKHVRDGIADAFGMDDRDRKRIAFEYGQEKGKKGEYSARAEIKIGEGTP